MKENRKKLAIAIIVLFVGASVIPSTVGINEEKTSFMGFNPRGNILYVGGSGPGNYTKIQDAIDNASDGDTVYVYNGTYYEHGVIINKSLTVIGENKYSTIIDGCCEGHIIHITGNNVNLSGFTIQNAKDKWLTPWSGYWHVYIDSGNNTISENIIRHTSSPICVGIYIRNSPNNDHNNILNNVFSSLQRSIRLDDSSYNNISGNTVVNDSLNTIGMELYESKHNMIYENTICTFDGILLYDDSNFNRIIANTVIHNPLEGEKGGSGIYSCGYPSISHNNIISWNYVTADFLRGIGFCYDHHSNASYNTIKDCRNGFDVQTCQNVTLYMNDIINCTIDIYIIYEPGYNMSVSPIRNKMPNSFLKNNLGMGVKSVMYLFISFLGNYFDGNFWGRPRILPKLIFARLKITEDFGIPLIPQFDWHPAKKPYDIPQVFL